MATYSPSLWRSDVSTWDWAEGPNRVLFIFSISLFFPQDTGSPPYLPMQITSCKQTSAKKHHWLERYSSSFKPYSICRPRGGNSSGQNWQTFEAWFLFSALHSCHYNAIFQQVEKYDLKQSIYPVKFMLTEPAFTRILSYRCLLPPTPSGICLLTECRQALWQVDSECQHKRWVSGKWNN